ncbi:CsbD family protein [Arthrobacter livingstonensis]|uniref:CsbD family protein n=1 Tax=Arthrobacter livingstonensis TaxID=670078 RepID=A0A2V5LDL7_9MICC|nr:CsbD family protein [Arthrobacter livingstonensis]PYI69709.1 CsbD family protein [Arthrobacter livingstonensis]
MGLNDKIGNSAEKGLGSAKEEAGKLVGNDELIHEGQREQASAEAKQAGEKIKDAAAEAGFNIKNAAQKLKDGFTKH